MLRVVSASELVEAVVKIAFVALPRQEDIQANRIVPPLPLGYVAALLEQRRHIVRIYDLALAQSGTLSSALAPLRSFRPHLVVVASESQEAVAGLEAVLERCGGRVMYLETSLRGSSISQEVARALWWAEQRSLATDEQNVIFEALVAIDDDLDMLPYPARHLLSLEQYPLLTLNGELQTTIRVAQETGAGYLSTRRPEQVLAELQSITREHGIRHFILSGLPLTCDQQWLETLLRHFARASLGVRWEATVEYDAVSSDVLQRMRDAGCETVCFCLVAGEVLVRREKRAHLSEIAEAAHALGLGVRAKIYLDPPYNMMPSLIDVSATLGLDAVSFHIQPDAKTEDQVSVDGVSTKDIAEMARTRYRSSRSRQFFVNRFGPQLGPMLWRVGRAGLLGRTWQRHADGGDEGALAF